MGGHGRKGGSQVSAPQWVAALHSRGGRVRMPRSHLRLVWERCHALAGVSKGYETGR